MKETMEITEIWEIMEKHDIKEICEIWEN